MEELLKQIQIFHFLQSLVKDYEVHEWGFREAGCFFLGGEKVTISLPWRLQLTELYSPCIVYSCQQNNPQMKNNINEVSDQMFH